LTSNSFNAISQSFTAGGGNEPSKEGKIKKQLMILPLVILLCVTFGCQYGEKVAEEHAVDVDADITAIQGLLDEFDESLSVGDPERLVSIYYAEDAVRMPPDIPMLRGKAAILERFKKRAALYTYQIDNVAKDVYVDGDLAFMRGTNTGTFTPKAGGEPIPAIGKWLAVFKRQVDGSWKCICDIYNRDNPLPESAEKE
jgi:ketosteroid isomerase-like protein